MQATFQTVVYGGITWNWITIKWQTKAKTWHEQVHNTHQTFSNQTRPPHPRVPLRRAPVGQKNPKIQFSVLQLDIIP